MAKHHYVSQFHLKQFTDPDSLSLKDPWLWQGLVPDGPVTRRAPKNIAAVTLMFDGPGGLADRESTLESFLANEVEGPAAEAIREVCRHPRGSGGELPPALTRYLAWAAARSLPMRKLMQFWLDKGFGQSDALVEPPPKGLLDTTDPKRTVQLRHPTLGSRCLPAKTDLDSHFAEGWVLDMSDPANFLEMVHMQAYYFQARFFPRLNWFTLHAPEGEFFIIADRAVGWAADGYINAPPNCLRDPSAYILAPISRDLVLMARNAKERWQVSPRRVNAVIACWAVDWIAGPTESVVEQALADRAVAITK